MKKETCNPNNHNLHVTHEGVCPDCGGTKLVDADRPTPSADVQERAKDDPTEAEEFAEHCGLNYHPFISNGEVVWSNNGHFSTKELYKKFNPNHLAGASSGMQWVKGKVKRITLCGSTKFKAEFEAINRQLTLEGNIVYSVCAFGHKDNIQWTKEQKELLDEVHKRKIDNSDGIFVINVDDYIGESTRSEIEYAEYTGKFVKYLSDFPDLKYISDAAMVSHSSMQAENERLRVIIKDLLGDGKYLHTIGNISGNYEERSSVVKATEALNKQQ